jgi:hypothetical protein
MRKEAVTVTKDRDTKFMQRLRQEHNWPAPPEKWIVRHWGQFVTYCHSEAEANEQADELRRKLDRQRLEREDRRRRAREHSGYLRRQTTAQEQTEPPFQFPAILL